MGIFTGENKCGTVGEVDICGGGGANILSLAFAIAKGMVTQVLLNCALTSVLWEAATTVLKIVGIV